MGQKAHILREVFNSVNIEIFMPLRKEKSFMRFAPSIFCFLLLMAPMSAFSAPENCTWSYCGGLRIRATGTPTQCMTQNGSCPGHLECGKDADCYSGKFVPPNGSTAVINGKTYYKNSTGGYQATPPNTSLTK